jgi:malonate transporter
VVLLLDSIAPVFLVIALGYVLRRQGMIDEKFLNVSDRLIYFIFFPALLFWKIGKPSPSGGLDWNLILAVISAVFVIFVLGLLFVKLFRIQDYEVGSFSQGCYRFSTYIGMAVIFSALGEAGVRSFGVLIGFVIPFINILAVSSLIWFSGESYAWNRQALILGKAMISNPLIIACGCGIAYSSLKTPFPTFVDNTLGLMALLALPLALISIGGSLTFTKFKGNASLALISTVFKLVLLPIIGYFLLWTFDVSGLSSKVAMLYFALPTSPSNYILSAQLNSDVDLAGATVVISTLLCVVSLSVVLIIFC